MNRNALLVGIVLLFFGKKVYGLKCYDCFSYTVGCGDPFPEDPLSIRQVECMGSCGKTKRSENDVTRFCNRGYSETKCSSVRSVNSKTMEVCACNTDLCNSATKYNASFLLAVANMFLVEVFFR